MLHNLAKCGIIIKGSLWLWGSNEFGQLGIGDVRNSYNAPIMVMEDVEKVLIEENVTFAIKKDGTLWGFGQDVGSKPVHLADDVAFASMSKNMLAVVDRNGTLLFLRRM